MHYVKRVIVSCCCLVSLISYSMQQHSQVERKRTAQNIRDTHAIMATGFKGSDGRVWHALPTTVQNLVFEYARESEYGSPYGQVPAGNDTGTQIISLSCDTTELSVVVRKSLNEVIRRHFDLKTGRFLAENILPRGKCLCYQGNVIKVTESTKSTKSARASQQTMLSLFKRDGSKIEAACNLKRDEILVTPDGRTVAVIENPPGTTDQFSGGIDCEISLGSFPDGHLWVWDTITKSSICRSYKKWSNFIITSGDLSPCGRIALAMKDEHEQGQLSRYVTGYSSSFEVWTSKGKIVQRKFGLSGPHIPKWFDSFGRKQSHESDYDYVKFLDPHHLITKGLGKLSLWRVPADVDPITLVSEQVLKQDACVVAATDCGDKVVTRCGNTTAVYTVDAREGISLFIEPKDIGEIGGSFHNMPNYELCVISNDGQYLAIAQGNWIKILTLKSAYQRFLENQECLRQTLW